jgi:primosomal protein N' (replication factor Y)
MLLESSSRQALQQLLLHWHPILLALNKEPAHKGVLRWSIDVDPLSI